MLNLKKGLALVLAAATAFTYVPLSNLSAPVTAQAATTPQIVLKDGANDAESSYDLAAITGTKILDLTVTDGNADKISWTSKDSRIATASLSATETTPATGATDDGTKTNYSVTGSGAYTSAVKPKFQIKAGSTPGTTEIVLSIGKKDLKTITVNVIGTQSTTSAVATKKVTVPAGTTNAKIGSVAITGENYSETLSQVPTITGTPTATASAGNKGGNLTSVKFGTAKVNSSTSATAEITANTTGAQPGDKFTITIPNSAKVDSTTAITGDTKYEVTVVSKATSEFTYGGVLTDIYAYKNASYDLAEHATISYVPQGDAANNDASAQTLNSNELTWWVVDDNTNLEVGQTRDTDGYKIRSLSIPTTAGTITQGTAGSIKVTVNDPTAFKDAVDGKFLVAEAYVNGLRTIVYKSGTLKVRLLGTTSTNVKEISAGISVSKQGRGTIDGDKEIAVLDEKIANPDKDNIFLKASEVATAYPNSETSQYETGNKYKLTVKTGSGNDNPFKGSFLKLVDPKLGDGKLPTGNYYETAYIPFTVEGSTNTVYVLKVNITVSVNTGVQFRVKDGSSILATTYGTDELAKDPTVYLNLADKKTFDIFDHIESDVDKTKVSFSYDKDSANVDVDSKGVITPKSVGNAVVTIKASYNGIESSTTLRVRVSQYGFDTVTVKGQDGETARVLSVRDYDNNNEKDINEAAGNDGEYQLVTRQIPYVEIHITGSESSNVVESPVATSANGAALSYSFDDDVKTMSARGLTIDPSTGKITLDYNKCKTGDVLGVYAVKVVSAATSKSEATTSYYYVVVDYPDQPIKGLEDNYTVGTCNDNSRYHTDYPAVELYEESGKTAKNFTEVNKNTDDFKGASLYADDNTDAFDVTAIGQTGRNNSILNPTSGKASIDRATADKQTMHVVAFNAKDQTKKVGGTYKLITVTSAPAVENKVVKITNRDTGAVIYDDAKDSKKTAVRLSINDITHIQVTLAYPVAASGSSLVTTELKGHDGDHDGDVVNQYRYVTAVLNSNDIDATLYPNEKGTQVIGVMPGGHLTNTDRRDIHKKEVKLAVEYDGSNGNTAKPAKITGVKVGNKKGAKVVVKFTKSSLDKNGLSMKYYVQKKVGKKTSGKSIGSARTTLSVKKGATVKVRVKAYYYDAAGQKHVGAYSKWVTKKTDKK